MYKVEKLNNGLKIVSEKNEFVRSIAFGIWIKSGTIFENYENQGISHFIEHMLFKGTKNRDGKQLANEMDKIGGQINAFTSKEYTCFYTVTLDEHLEKSIDILSDMLFNSNFSSEDIIKEKSVVQEEINMCEDSPEDVVFDTLQKEIWGNNTLGLPILGTSDSINSLDRSKILKYFNKRYIPSNVVISVVGSFEDEKLASLINKYFGNWQKKESSEAVADKIIYNKKCFNVYKDIEQIHLCMGFEGIKLGSDEAYSLAIVSTILGGGVSSRLFQKIREEKGLAYSIYSYALNYTDAGLFTICSAMNPKQFDQVFDLIIAEIEKLKTDLIKDEELSATKEQLKTNIILGLESTGSRMNSIGKSQLLFNKVKTADDILEKVNEVTIDMVRKTINKIFNLDKLSIGIVGRTDKLNLERIEKYVHKN